MIHCRRQRRGGKKEPTNILTSLSVQLERVVYRVQYYGRYPYQADYHDQQSMGGAFCGNTLISSRSGGRAGKRREERGGKKK